MTQPLGEEFIRIRPDASGFRAELNAQIGSALQGVRAQAAAATAQVGQAVRQQVTPGGVILPPGVRSVQQQAQRTRSTARATDQQLKALSNTQRVVAKETANLSASLGRAERDIGRYTRGVVAATAASTGFFRAVSFASGAFLIGATIGATIGTATNEFVEMTRVGAQTAAILKATGEAANVTAAQVDALASKQLRLTGIDDELTKRSENVLLTFRAIRNEVGASNQVFTRAVRDVADISAVFGTDLRGSAVQLGKALQDPVRGVTALRRSGITLSQSQRDLIKNLVETGRILTAQKLILSEVERQVGGTAEAFGRTLPGRLAVLRESSVNALGDLVKRLTESRQATELAAQGSKALTQTFGAMKAVVEALGPSLVTLAQGAAGFVQALGGGAAILAAAVAFKSVNVAIGLTNTAQAAYTKNVLIGTGAINRETAAILAQAGAFRALSLAQLSGSKIKIGDEIVKVGAQAGSISRGARAIALLRGAVSGLGVGTVAAVGLGAVIAGVIKLRQIAGPAPGSIRAIKEALDDLNTTVARGIKLSEALAGRREAVSIARFNVIAAQRTLEQLRNRLAGSGFEEGSIGQRALAEQIAQAEQKVVEANRELVAAERQRDIAEEQFAHNQRSRTFIIADQTKKLQEQIAAIIATGQVLRTRRIAPEIVRADTIRRFTEAMQELGKTSGAAAKVGKALEALRVITDKLPTSKQIEIAVRVAGEGGSIAEILRDLNIGEAGTEAIRTRGLHIVQATTTSLQEQDRALAGIIRKAREELVPLREKLRQRRAELATQREAVAAARDAVAAARESRSAAIQGLADAERGLSDAHRNLTDTIRESNQAIREAVQASRDSVNQAVQDAKQNLADLGQAIAEALGKFREATAGATTGGALGERFRKLRAEILAGAGGPETIKAAQKIAFEIQAQRTPEATSDKLQQDFADLTDKLARGQITARQFTAELNKLLKGFDIRAFTREFGTAAANTLQEQIKRIRRQAGLIEDSPRRPGGALAVALVNPLQAVAKGARDIAAARRQAAADISSAQRDMADATRDVTDAQKDIVRADRQLAAAERRLRLAQSRETRANTRAIEANTKVQAQRLKIERAQERRGQVDKPKPRGGVPDDNVVRPRQPVLP